ncbi:MAG: hypothetical protein L3J66_05725 [Bacteroidales bacterium]|nr:hypothetical protein [Bacteroidales bacterium]
MLKYFDSAYFQRTVVLVAFAALSWLPAFLLPAQTAVSGQAPPLYRAFLFVSGNHVFIHLSFAFSLTIASALLLNQIATEFGITEKISQLALFVFILFSSSLAGYTAMSQVIAVNFLMIFFLRWSFRVTETKEHIPLVFNASFVVGAAALFYLPAALFILLLWIALLVFGVGQWRNFIVSLTGVSLPFLFVFTWYFWFDETGGAYDLLLSSLRFHVPELSNFRPADLTIVVILSALILVSIVKTNNSLMERNINLRQMLIVLLNYLAIAFALVLFFSDNYAGSLLLAIPASLLLASTITGAKNTKWYEWSVRLLGVLILFNQYFRLFYAA